MAEEFQTGICGRNWWDLSKSVFMGGGSLPCSSTGINTSDMGSFGSWLVTDVVDFKPRSISCKDFSNNNNNDNSFVSDASIVFQDSKMPHHQQHNDSDSGGSSILMDSTLQMLGFGISSSSSSSSSDWTQTLLRGNERCENNYNSILQEEMNSCQIQKDWSPKSYTSTGEDSSINAFKAINNNNNQDFSLEQQNLNFLANNSTTTTTTITATGGFSTGSASYGYPSTLIQSLFDPDPQTLLQPQPQQSLLNNQTINTYSSPRPPPPNYGTVLNELSPSWPKLAPFIEPPLPIKPTGGLHFSNSTPFWNASATALNDIRPTFLTTSQPQFLVPTFEEKPNGPNLTTKSNNNEEVRDSESVVKKGSEPALKRPRIETTSPLPTFKVRKEKLGDRITALQQLVSPFGKTDTASVLHEAFEYIKFLHDQVNGLSTPYMKNGNPVQHQQANEKMEEQLAEGSKQDLRSKGLCLVPISSTFPVANETTADFWTTTFGGSLR